MICQSYPHFNYIGHIYMGHIYMGHIYIGHTSIGYDYMGHNYICHTYGGHDCICHNYIGPAARRWLARMGMTDQAWPAMLVPRMHLLAITTQAISR